MLVKPASSCLDCDTNVQNRVMLFTVKNEHVILNKLVCPYIHQYETQNSKKWFVFVLNMQMILLLAFFKGLISGRNVHRQNTIQQIHVSNFKARKMQFNEYAIE